MAEDKDLNCFKYLNLRLDVKIIEKFNCLKDVHGEYSADFFQRLLDSYLRDKPDLRREIEAIVDAKLKIKC